MQKLKRLNPYQMLLKEITDFCRKLQFPHTRTMFIYPKEKLNTGWSLTDLYERTAAAKQLGYDTVIEATDQGLIVRYRKELPTIPWNWK